MVACRKPTTMLIYLVPIHISVQALFSHTTASLTDHAEHISLGHRVS